MGVYASGQSSLAVNQVVKFGGSNPSRSHQITRSKMKIFILTGAGISAESGIQTFRSSNGLWNNHSVNDVASIQGYQKNPSVVLDFYNERRLEMNNVSPNEGHYAISEIINDSGHDVTLVTQNVDNLHELSGSTDCIHMHGSINEVLCSCCNDVYSSRESLYVDSICPSCHQTGLRPNIVFFGEIPHRIDEILDHVKNCDLFLSIGTSGKVMPASKFARTAKKKKAYTISVNIEKSFNWDFKEELLGSASVVLPEFIKKLNSGFYDEIVSERKGVSRNNKVC